LNLFEERNSEGLWLTSTVADAVPERFRLMATAVRRQAPGALSGFGFWDLDLNDATSRELPARIKRV
jgi:hypothetical protein